MNVSVPAGTVTVAHDDTVVPAVLARTIKTLGYGVTGQGPVDAHTSAPKADQDHRGHKHDHDHDHDHGAEAEAGLHGHLHDHGPSEGPWWKSQRGLLTIACGLALVAAYGIGQLFPQTGHWAFVLAMAVGLVPIARRALVAARFGTPFSIEMLMTIAAVGAVIIGATEEAAMVVFLFLVGELLEGVAAGRARASIQGLTKLVPKTALLERNGRTEEVQAETLAVGSIILIRPGDRVPADGVIVAGESAIDEAPVTGESVPKRKSVDDTVFAGTINGDGALRVRVTAAAQDNTIARIVRLVEEAQESKAPTERFIDRFSRYYTPAVLVVGALVAIVPPLLFGALVGRVGLQGPGDPADRLPVRARDLDAGRHRGRPVGGRPPRPADEGRRRAGEPRQDHHGGLRQDRHADRGQAQGHGRDPGRRAPSARCCPWPPRWRPDRAIRSRRRSSPRPRRPRLPFRPLRTAGAVGGKGVTGSVGGVPLFLGSPKAADERVALTPEQTALDRQPSTTRARPSRCCSPGTRSPG